MSPIFTRPYREQHEHDRIIRQLQARYRRKHDVVINPGAEQHGAVTVGELPVYPDLLLYSQEPTRHLEALVEVETGESVHLLEARAEWGVFSQVPVPFILYVPLSMLETARRIIDEQQWRVSEIWTYLPGMDQLRFVQMFKHPNPPVVVPPKMPARAKGKTATPAPSAPSPKAAASAGIPTRASEARSPKSAPQSGTTQGRSAAKPSGKTAAKPALKTAGRTGSARPAAQAKATPQTAVDTGRSRALSSRSAAKGAPSGKKGLASKKAAPSGTTKAKSTRASTADGKKSVAGGKKSSAGATSGSTKAGAGRGSASKTSSSTGKAARRR